jgi:hypothetical protein
MDTVTCEGCGKRAYPSRRIAQEVARFARKGDDVKGKRRPPMSVYTCPAGSIHLTSQKSHRDHPEVTKAQRRQRGRRGR